MMVAACVFLFSLSIPAPVFAAQMMMGAGRAKTTGPTVTKIAPPRAKTVHKATPKSLLVVKDISIKPENPQLGDKVAIHAIVANNGPKAVKGVKVAFYLGRQQVAWQVYDIKSKGKQAYVGYFTKKQAPKAGTYTISVLVDPNRTLERVFYKCNSATMKVALTAMIKNTRTRTVSKPRIHPRTVKTVGKEASNNSHKMNTTREIPGHVSVSKKRLPSGKITNVTVKVKTQAVLKARQKQKSHVFDIRWTRKGILPSHVDIFLYPYRQFHSGMYLKRNISNNGHVFLPVPEKVNPQKEYIIRVQTHNGKIYGESRTFRLSPAAAMMVQKTWKGNTAAKTARNAKLKSTSGHVKLDPGIGPNHTRINSSATKAAKKGITLPGKMTTYGPQPGSPPGGGTWKTITAPKENDKWESGKTYRIKWQPSGVVVTKVAWTNITTKASHDIFSSTTAPITAGYMDWAISRTMATGNYVITITVEGAPVKSKNFLITVPAWGKASFKKPSLTLRSETPSTGIKKGYSSPRITYFDYSVSYSNRYVLRLQFYWEDSGKDLHKGSWTFGYKYNGKWYKKSGAIAKLPYHDDFLGAKGMNTFEIPFDKKWKGKTVPIAFYLTDAMGLTSNVVKGTADFIDGTSTSLRPPAPLVATSDPITFLIPNSYINHLFIKGTKIDIQLAMSAKLKAQNPPIKIELIPYAKAENPTVIYNKPLPKGGHISWTSPKSIPAGAYFFKASATNPSASAKSGTFSFDDKGISLITPKNGSHFKVGDTILFQWKAFGLSEKESMNIISSNDGTPLNKKPIPVKDGSWSFIIKPGTMPTGKFPVAFRLNPSGDSIGEAFITVAYPNNIVPPSIIFKNPAPGATVKWLAGASEKIEWEQSGEYSENTQVTFILNSVAYGHPDAHISCFLKKISVPAGGHLKKISQVKISSQFIPAGIYRLTAYFPFGIAGEGGVIEVIDQNADMLPAPDTKFSITGVDYPVAGGPMTVHIHVKATKAFRLGNIGAQQGDGTQYLAYRITNYTRYGTQMGNVANDSISVMKNFSLFPQHVIPKGISNYTIQFRPELKRMPSPVKIHQPKPWPFGDCVTLYYPKLELSLVTQTAGNSTSDYRATYLKNPNMKIRESTIGGTAQGVCLGEISW